MLLLFWLGNSRKGAVSRQTLMCLGQWGSALRRCGSDGVCDAGWAVKDAGRAVCLQDRIWGCLGALTAGDLCYSRRRRLGPPVKVGCSRGKG